MENENNTLYDTAVNSEETPADLDSNSQVKVCTNCGAQLADNDLFCAACGQSCTDNGTQQAPPAYNAPNAPNFNGYNPYPPFDGVPMPPPGVPVSRKEFINNYAPESFKKNIRTVAVICYICAALTIISALLTNPVGIIDGLILLGLALGVHIGKSKVCAILLLIFSIIETVISIALLGSFPFWWLIAGIYGVVIFSKIDKHYNQFLNR